MYIELSRPDGLPESSADVTTSIQQPSEGPIPDGAERLLYGAAGIGLVLASVFVANAALKAAGEKLHLAERRRREEFMRPKPHLSRADQLRALGEISENEEE